MFDLFPRSNPSLPQNDNSHQQRERARQIAKEQKEYQWDDNKPNVKGVPMALDVPSESKPTIEWTLTVGEAGVEVAKNLLANLDLENELGHINEDLVSAREALASVTAGREKSLIKSLKDLIDELVETQEQHIKERLRELKAEDGLDAYKNLFKTLSVPDIASTFQSDECFARLRVAGPNPMLLSRINQLPANFPVSNEGYQQVMGDDDLQSALEANRVYLLDYQELSLLAEHPGSSDKQVFAPLALFALTEGRDELKPVAIQCGQTSEFKVAYAVADQQDEGYWEWQVSKTIVQMSEGNYHELFVHLARTHLLIEAFTVATHRHLAEKHPLNILLMPHFEGTLNINASAAGSLIAEGGPIDNIFAAEIKYTQQAAGEDRLGYDFYASMLPNDLERRGVASKEDLPDYPYRDDAILVWGAIRDWVQDYVAIYYKKDQDVVEDTELTAWTDALISDGKVKGFKPIADRSQLVDVLTMVIFTGSAQHAAVNFPQKSLMSYAPAISGAVWGLEPLSANTEEQWLTLLAPIPKALEQLSVLYLLGSVYYRKLGEYRSNHFPYLSWFEDDKITDSGGPLDRFNEVLEEVESKINDRNNNRPEYSYLLPSKIPPSINI